MKKVRGAIAGCGMISEFHLRGWKRIEEVEIIALCNRTVERAEKRRAEFVPNARVYSSLDAMLVAEELDFIDILTAPELHFEQCHAAMAAGLYIVCQKPLSDNLDLATKLVATAKHYPKCFAIHENHRYRPWFQHVRSLLKGGELGNPIFLRLEHLNATEPLEIYKNEAAAGVWLEYGSHLVDMMRSVLGEPRRVHGRMHHLNPNVNGESLAHATFEYPNCTAVIEAAWKLGAVTQSSLLLAGDAGEAWFEGTFTRGQEGRLRINKGKVLVSDRFVSPIDEYVESFYLLQREFIDAVLGLGQLTQTGEEHLRTLRCTIAAYDSASNRALTEIRSVNGKN